MEPHERILKREYKKGIYDLRKEQNLCYRCGKICEWNDKLKRFYIQCKEHRIYSNKQSSIYKKCVNAVLSKKQLINRYKN